MRSIEHAHTANNEFSSSRAMAANSVDDPSPPSKRAKTGAATYGTKFKPEWSKNLPFVSKSHADPVYSFYCCVCRAVAIGAAGAAISAPILRTWPYTSWFSTV